MAEMNKLAALFGGKPPLGSGAAQRAAEILASRPYQLHVQEARAMGQEPMTPEQWAKAMGKGA